MSVRPTTPKRKYDRESLHTFSVTCFAALEQGFRSPVEIKAILTRGALLDVLVSLEQRLCSAILTVRANVVDWCDTLWGLVDDPARGRFVKFVAFELIKRLSQFEKLILKLCYKLFEVRIRQLRIRNVAVESAYPSNQFRLLSGLLTARKALKTFRSFCESSPRVRRRSNEAQRLADSAEIDFHNVLSRLRWVIEQKAKANRQIRATRECAR